MKHLYLFYLVHCTTGIETCPSKYRGAVGNGVGLTYSAGCVVFAAMGYFLRSWRDLYMGMTYPSFLILPLSL